MSAAKRIAQVAPLYERVPPLYYGGTERIVSYLSEELERGHGVMLFASGDSITNTHLVAACESGLRLNPRTADHQACNVVQLEQVLRDADSFDVIFYIDWLHFPSCKRMGTANVTTFHGRLDLPELVLLLLEEFDDLPVISIFAAQPSPLPYIVKTPVHENLICAGSALASTFGGMVRRICLAALIYAQFEFSEAA